MSDEEYERITHLEQAGYDGRRVYGPAPQWGAHVFFGLVVLLSLLVCIYGNSGVVLLGWLVFGVWHIAKE